MNDFQAGLTGAFVFALLGGVHCAAMCGGFVGALQLRRPPQLSRVTFAVASHGGRLMGYAGAGALAGALGGALYAADVLPAQIALLLVAGAALLAIGLSLLGRSSWLRRLEPVGGVLWRLVQPLTRRLLPPRTVPAALLAGVAWGWIPCGMVYATLPLALIAGGPARGAAVMLAFGLGTLPNLVLLDLAAAGVAQRLSRAPARAWLRALAGAVVLAFGVSDLAHAAHLAGVNDPAVALLASICHRS